MGIDDIDDLIHNERFEIRIYIIFTIGIFIFGILLIIFGSTQNNSKEIIQVGGALVSAISTFPISRILFIYKRILIFKLAKRKISSGINDDEIIKIRESIIKNVTSIIEGNNK